MNKYQEYLLSQKTNSNIGTFLFANCAPSGEKCEDSTYGIYDSATGSFLIKQDPDITKTIYDLVISKNDCPFIESVHVKKGASYSDIPLSVVTSATPSCKSVKTEARFIITVNFNDRIDAIKLSFIKNIADDLEIGISYQEADRQAYAARQAALQKENTLNRAAIKHSVGESLINIYFQPCADNYDHTEISLFIPDKTERQQVGGPYGPVNKENVLSWSLIMNVRVENGLFFKSISGLAYGRYSYIVKQYDNANNLLTETDYIEFKIERPKPVIDPRSRIGYNVI